MKVLVFDSPVKPIEEPEKCDIQGLYSIKNCCQSFWSLKAKIELAIFHHEVFEIKFQDEPTGETKQ